MQAFEESQLVEAARQGSDAAFSELLKAYQDRLLRFLMARASSEADAEDALQECFVNAYRYIRTYNTRWQFSTWLYRIALRELAKIARKSQRQVGLSEPPSGGSDPLAACIRQDDRDNLWLLARSCLSESAYTTLWLRYAEDLPVREVAMIVGRPETWVKVVLHRARKKLAAHSVRRPLPNNTPAPADSDGRRSGSAKLKAETVV